MPNLMPEPANPHPLRIQLFGGFHLWTGGDSCARLQPRTAQVALAFLVLRGEQPVERSVLAGLLWPESSPETGLANLRRYLVEIRAVLGQEAGRLTSPTPRSLSLDLSGAWCDVLAFDELVADGTPGSLAQAVELYRGPLLEGCSSEWLLPERETRAQQYLLALHALGEDAAAAGDLASAAGCFRRAAAVDPCWETAHRSLMRVLAETGNVAAATLVYRELRERLHRELNAQPDPATTALFSRLRSQPRGTREAPPAESLTDAAPPGAGPIPRPLSSFVGREQETTVVRDLLATGRLVTITGAGGVGKTRLALRVAEAASSAFPGGIFVAELGGVSDDRAIAAAVAAAVGMTERGEGVEAALCRELSPRRALLLLDNCEHLLPGSARLATRVLSAAPELRLLATSRQALGVPGELAYRLPSLSLPARDEERALEADAVRLFLDRARGATAAFQVTPQNLPVIVRICRRLDGIPLAVELAAAWVRSLSVETIERRLDEPLKLLAGTAPAPERHRTVRALIDWSYALLSAEERHALQQLSVFAGAWSLEAAAAVLAPSGSGDRRETVSAVRRGLPDSEASWEALALLTRLIDRSLVTFDPRHGRDRYRLLNVIAEFARERLEESLEAAPARNRHLEYFLKQAEKEASLLRGPFQGQALARLDDQFENLLAAHQWCDRTGDGAEAGLRLMSSLRDYWPNRGSFELGLRLTQEALERGEGEDQPLRARVLLSAAELACNLGRLSEAQRYAEESLAIYRQWRHPGTCSALTNLGMIAIDRGDRSAARRLLERCVRLARRRGEELLAGAAVNGLAELARLELDFSRADALFRTCLERHRQSGSSEAISGSLMNLAMVALECGRPAEARRHLAESVELITRDGLTARAQSALDVAAGLAWALGEPELAAHWSRTSEAVLSRLGMRRSLADAEFCRRWPAQARQADPQPSTPSPEPVLPLDDALAELRDWVVAGHQTART